MEVIPRMDSKGQAALTDAMYFLMIVSGLAAFLFFFTVNYGLSLEQQAGRIYRAEYASSALKTILYSSTPRTPGESFDEAEEIDYLLAAVKEDYADDREIDETKEILRNNIVTIMEPFSPGYDYLFYIYLSQKKEFIYMIIYRRGERNEDGGFSREDKIYFCKPESINDLDKLLLLVGSTAQADSKMIFIDSSEASEGRFYAHVNLTMWTAASGLSDDLFTELQCPENAAVEFKAIKSNI